LIPLYTAFLSPADYGTLDLLTTFGGVLFILMRLGVPGAVSRFYYEHHEGPALRDYLTTIGWFQIWASLIVATVTLLLWPVLERAFLPGAVLIPLGLVMVVTQVLSGNSDIQRRVIQCREQSSYSAKLSTATATLQIVSAVIFIAVLRMGVHG